MIYFQTIANKKTNSTPHFLRISFALINNNLSLKGAGSREFVINN